MTDEVTGPTSSSHFRKMADAIDHNAAGSFGGACVIVPPGGCVPIELLILDSAQDTAQFLATIITRCQQIVSEMDKQQRQLQGFGR